jgi:hypothetical protein
MKKAIFPMIILGLAISTSAVYAQEAQPAEGQEAYGEVVSIDAKADTITITEYDYDKDEDVNKTYTVDKAAGYENVKSLADIVVGDWVALTLKTGKDGKATATSVYVERYDLGEEAVPPAAPAAKPAAPAEVTVPETPAAPAEPAPATTEPQAPPQTTEEEPVE